MTRLLVEQMSGSKRTSVMSASGKVQIDSMCRQQVRLASECATISSMSQDNFQDGRQFLTAHQPEIEQTLEGVYAWNSETAKYGVLWVFLTWTFRAAALIGALTSTAMALVLLTLGSDIQVFTFDPIRHHTWFLWGAASMAFLVGFTFFSLIHSAVRRSHQVSIELSKRR